MQLYTPHSGPVVGGTVVTVLGSDFDAALPLRANFSGEFDVATSFVNTGAITFITPNAATAREIDVSLFLNNQQNINLGPFMFYGMWILSSFHCR